MKPKRDSDWLIEQFSATWAVIEKNGLETYRAPKWRDFRGDYMVRGDEIAQPMWLCKCGVENLERATACEECGRKRP
jgi:hypothetical protein